MSTFTVTTKPATGTGDIDGYAATCDACGYVIAYSIRSMAERDMAGHCANYCRGPVSDYVISGLPTRALAEFPWR